MKGKGGMVAGGSVARGGGVMDAAPLSCHQDHPQASRLEFNIPTVSGGGGAGGGCQ